MQQNDILSDKRREDARLIQRCKDDVPGAFDELIAKYERCVYNYAYKLAGNYNDASDITQEAFIKAYNSIKKFRGDAVFTTWIYRIVTNVYLDERKRTINRKCTSLEEKIDGRDITLGMQMRDGAPTPDKVLEKKEKMAIVRKLMDSLPDYQKIILTLYQFEELSYEEISEILKLPLGTVKSRLNRARTALAEKMQEYRELFI